MRTLHSPFRVNLGNIILCALLLPLSFIIAAQEHPDPEASPKSILDDRQDSDSKALSNPYAISQYRQNYLLPFTYAKDPNPIGVIDGESQTLDNFEAKYQISMKLPIHLNSDNQSGLFFGFTAVSFWQVYNSAISKPFRETNYEPEIFYSWQSNLRMLGIEFNQVQLGLNHQSNGQTGLRSRSWNRLYTSALFSDEDSIYYIKAWYRFKEDPKVDPFSSNGDDNPDITHYLGHMEIGYGKKVGKFNVLALVTNNLKTSDNKGSIELNITYPINSRYDVLLQYFNGYGDSLIDYNRHQQRIGLGVQLKFL